MAHDPFTTFEIAFVSEDEASIGRLRLEEAGFTVEADTETSLRAGITDPDGGASARVDAAIDGLRYDPLIYSQTATLERFL